MTNADYFRILGIPSDSSVEQVKKAYRQKARELHPDINHEPDAKERFIEATEAYEYLLGRFDDYEHEDELEKMNREWERFRRERARQKAKAYARASYAQFRNSKLYKTTRIFDGSIIVFSIAIAILLNIYIVAGYLYRLKHPLPAGENPTILTFILIEVGGILILTIALIYLKAFIEKGKKTRAKSK